MKNKILSSKTNYIGSITFSGNYSIYQVNNLLGAEALLNKEFVLLIRKELSDYMGMNNLDIINNGVRIILNIKSDGKLTLAFAHKAVPAQGVHDWLAPNNSEWKPINKKSGFFQFIDDAVTEGLDKMKFGNKLIYLDNDKTQTDLIAVEDGRPTAKVHFLILAKGLETTGNGTYMDKNFSDEMWVKLFKLAYQISNEHRNIGNEIMITSNMGMFLQSGPVAHMHVQIDSKIPSWNPLDYGKIETLDDYRIKLSDEDAKTYKEIIEKYLPQTMDGIKTAQSQEGLEEKLKQFFDEIIN